ncbi:Xaa-Pro aminopeptidase [Sphaerochaeta pleomorpha str. Grapes]|uniref:Xaa-Pro aminopeptidase n=1 Tax=Sphaerochaeta pleomorpha (strain ATCC BAA-1885 / DSM 22778 / Grapes) TaxID=158190 RepID=G8QVU3_SPHPG|nr:M24 family metallopeptidase [Sphaerochaeta pleomorpha]AEV30467.1 Xaa-Pro aminopeptidase [Sphaerochaeta pleomorpha str. Grapes]
MPRIIDSTSPYWIDNRSRVADIQRMMEKEGLDVYLGTRLRTLSFVLDAFCPWRSFLVIPAKGDPVLFTFLVDAARVADETWLPIDNVRAYAPMGGQDQISVVSQMITDELGLSKGRLGVEDGISTYTPEGNLTHYEWKALQAALNGWEFVNAHHIVDEISFIKDAGTIARFREASRIVDEGQKAAREALEHGGWKGMTETEIAGIAALAMRRAGSVSEWNFAGLNEISSGYRTGLGACTPPTNRVFQAGEPLMLDFHSMFMLALGDHSHNYLIGPSSPSLRKHADNFVDLVETVLANYKQGATPSSLSSIMMDRAEVLGCADYLLPGCEHGIGLFGDEWRIGHANAGPFPYWTDPDHEYKAGELLICAMQYAAPDQGVGFRYENPILIGTKGCETLSKFPLAIEEIV